MVLFAALVGFLGPFGTYLEADFPARAWKWWLHLMGAYVIVRPTILLWSAIAQATNLPQKWLVFWGVVLSSVPLASLWHWGASEFFHSLHGFTGILPFAFLCAVAVLVVATSARKLDALLRRGSVMAELVGTPSRPNDANPLERGDIAVEDREMKERSEPRLHDRLGANFVGPISALQSEDHYVRVHGRDGSELILMRLRNAIAELDDYSGAQVHRCWWVAADGIASIEADGRNRTIVLRNGARAAVARDAVSKLERSGFLTAET
ncbi:LytTR family DNA-binding domain-containing protein (plasmid) [Novosphingobium sp. BL-8A]